MTALIIAAEQGNLDLISCLLSGKADPNAADHAEDRALHYLAQSECVGGIELLVGAGADLEATNEVVSWLEGALSALTGQADAVACCCQQRDD